VHILIGLVLGVALLLTGCVSIEEPVLVGKDTYLLSLGARGGMSSNGRLLTESIKSAGAFCAAKGLNLSVQSVESSGVQGWTPQGNQVVFYCLSDTDPAYARTRYKPRPSIVIENQ
jgi:hypothetical protein